MKILVIGVSVRAMVESAVRSRYSVAALDAFGDRDLAAIAESHSLHHNFRARYSAKALFEAGRQLSYDAIAYTSNLENHPEILRRLEGNHRIIGNSPCTVEAVRCWAALFPKLKQAGFSVPQTLFKDGIPGSERRWLMKPLMSGGGHGIEFFQKAKLQVESFMLQEFVAGKSCSASFIANGSNCVLIGITEQLIGLSPFGVGGFRYCGNVLPLKEASAVVRQIRRLADFLTREYGLSGVNGFDFILDGDRVAMTEINPRYSASMELIERAYNLPIFHLHTKAVLDGELPAFELESVLDSDVSFGKAVLFAEKDVDAPDTRNWMYRGIKDVPASGETLRKGGPVCTFLACGPSFGDTVTLLIRQADLIKKEIYG
jgi:uncharacterized protein